MPLKLTRRSATSNYYIRGTVAGCAVYESTHTSDRRAAEAILIRTEKKLLDRAAYGNKATATFVEAATNYIEAGGETRFLEPILRHFGPEHKLKDINNAAVNAAALAIYPDAKPSTINRQLITPISAIMTMAAEDELCSFIKLRRRRVKEKKTRWLTPEEFEVFAAHLGANLVPIIGFMIGTGARVRETLSLQASTLYLGTGQALLSDTKNDTPRMVRIPDRSAAMIRTRPVPETGAVFTTDRGKPYTINDNTGGQISRPFNRARDLAKLGREVTPHTIRHTWATWHYAQNRDFGTLLDLGGWSKADVANIYRKISPDDLGQRLLDHGWDFRPKDQIARTAPDLRLVQKS